MREQKSNEEIPDGLSTLRRRIAELEQLVANHKQVECELRECKDKYLELFENSIDSVLLTAPDGRILAANPEACRMFGRSEEEICRIGRAGLLDLTNSCLEAALEERKHTGRFQGELTYVRKDGTTFPGELSTYVFKDSYGNLRTSMIIRDITDHKLVQEKLQNSERRYREFFTTSRDCVFITSKDGEWIDFNDAALEMFGYESREELFQVPISSLYVNPDERTTLIALNEKQGYVKEYPALLRRRDGEVIDTLITTGFRQDANDSKIEYYGTIRDITRRKHAEESLAKSERKFSSVFQLNPNPMAITHMDTWKFIDVNQSFMSWTGYSSEEIIGNSPQDLHLWVNPEDPEKIASTLMAIGEVNGTEIMLRQKNGNVRNVIFSARFIEIEQERYLLTLTSDITKRKQAENKLRDSRRRLAEIIEFLPDATVVIDGKGKVIAWNRAIEAMTGVKAKEMLGKGNRAYALPFYGERRPLLIDLAIQADPEVEKSYTTLERQRDTIFGEGVVPNLPLGNRHLSATVSVFRNAQGKIVAAMECIRDRTEQVRTEEEKKKMQDQLFASQKMQAIGTLAGGIAHDFNNVLASMIGYTEMAIYMSKEDQTHKHLMHVIEAGERAKKLINQILAFSREKEQERKPVNIGLIAKEVLELLRSILPTTIDIRQDIATECMAVLADPTQIHQIIMNLCTNAAHAMREKGGVMEVIISNIEMTDDVHPCHPDLKMGTNVLLTIRDNGHGIDPVILERIYDPFFTTKKPGEGTGLGLSVVYGVVKSYGGMITVQSDVGKGTTFNVYFPCMPDTVWVQERQDEEKLIGGHEQILCIDDEESITRLIHEFLESIGYKVVSTTNCLEALSVYKEDPHRFDLVITDLTMPQMTGLDLAEKILSIRPEIPIVLCTGYNETFTLEDIKRRGLKDLIVKPIALKSLALRVRRALDA